MECRIACAYWGKDISREEMKNGTFIWIRELKYGKKSEMAFVDAGLSQFVHKKCFVPSFVEDHPCKRGWVE